MRFVTRSIRSVSIVNDDLGYKTIQPGVAPLRTNAFHGNWSFYMDSTVVGDWKKTSILALQRIDVASSFLGRYSSEFLSTPHCSLLARVG
jgi:hypothetical protein